RRRGCWSVEPRKAYMPPPSLHPHEPLCCASFGCRRPIPGDVFINLTESPVKINGRRHVGHCFVGAGSVKGHTEIFAKRGKLKIGRGCLLSVLVKVPECSL